MRNGGIRRLNQTKQSIDGDLTVMKTIRKFMACDSGVSALEYGLIIALVSAAGMAAMGELGGNLFTSPDATLAKTVDKVQPAAGSSN